MNSVLDSANITFPPNAFLLQDDNQVRSYINLAPL